ncbi:hypothetical protein ACOSQ2_021541 [Xanthoceras sorbifolium]
MSKNPVLHARTKNIELDLYFVRDKVLQKELIVNHVPSLDQTTDLFTKPLSSPRFLYLRRKLNVTDSPLSLRGHIRSKSDGADDTNTATSACVTTKHLHANNNSSTDATTNKSSVVHLMTKQLMKRSDHERPIFQLSFLVMNCVVPFVFSNFPNLFSTNKSKIHIFHKHFYHFQSVAHSAV